MKKPHPFDIALRDSIQPLLPSPAASVPASQSPTPPKGGSSRSKTATKGSRPQGSKPKAAKLEDEPMDEDIRATGIDIGVLHSQVVDLLSSHPPRAPAPSVFTSELLVKPNPSASSHLR